MINKFKSSPAIHCLYPKAAVGPPVHRSAADLAVGLVRVHQVTNLFQGWS